MIPDLSGLRLRPDEESVGALSLKPWAMLCVDMHRTVQERIQEYKTIQETKTNNKRGREEGDASGVHSNEEAKTSKRARREARREARMEEARMEEARREGTDLQKAYHLQCAWMRLCYAPSSPHDDMSEDLDRRVHTTEPLEAAEMEKFKESVNPVDLATFNLNVKLWQSKQQTMQNSELTQPQFKAMGSIREGKKSKIDQTLEEFIKTAACENSPLYADRHYKKFTMPMLSIEHIIPVSWLHATQAIDLCAYAGHDPIMVFACQTKINSQRGNQVLNFQGNPSYRRTWPAGTDDEKLWSDEQKAFAARATIYGLLTYPLISEDGQELRIDVVIPTTQRPNSVVPSSEVSIPTTQRPNSVVPSTMERYNLQIVSMVAHMQRAPPRWEVALAGALFQECGRINPLIVSKKAREAVADPKHPLGAFLRQRLSEESDALSRCLFAEFFRNVTR
tara:strand:- start:229 stop:1578 length:1350 start_codon:yes stop_codon:yes gene_type:complete